MKKEVWVVTFHFGRGHSETVEYINKQNAKNAIDIAVFNNEDCINCSIFRTERPLTFEEKADKVLSKM